MSFLTSAEAILYTLSDDTRGYTNKTQPVKQRCIHCDPFIVCRETMCKEGNLERPPDIC